MLQSRAEYVRGQGGTAVACHTARVVGVGPRAFLYSRAEPAAEAVGRAARPRHVMVRRSHGGRQQVEPSFCQTLIILILFKPKDFKPDLLDLQTSVS